MESTDPQNPESDPAEQPTQAAPPTGGGEPPPAPPEGASRRLMRSRSDRVLGGVCGGVARRWSLDPTLVRIGFVAGVILWGASAVLYLVALVLTPQEPEGTPPVAGPEVPGGAAAAPLAGRNRALAGIGVVVLVLIGGPILLGLGFAAAGVLVPFALLVLTGLGVAWLVTGRGPSGGDAGQITKLTLLGLGVLALLGLLAIGSFWGAAAGGDTVIAGAVIVAGMALVASAFARPARWLILPALALAIPAAFVAAAGIDLDGGVGEKRYRPASAADVRERYELGIGSLIVDLRDVDLAAGERRVELDVGMGEAVVLVPEDVCVSTTAELGAGGVAVFDHETGGVDVSWEDERTPPAGTPRLVVDGDVGLGALEIRHTEAEQWRYDSRIAERGNEACLA